ncbi:methyltransferase [Candidatus Woesearchaeota archaeon]|jgi:hypothetical protein|nr:methyltransferase [Candidatus Woesearchaeota archaeon]MBT3537127.1 methyltransferase [Candidatus Woesearchaeota archaeon]MBT4696956.1 methyltransferase [Candidatus Woesearchaeota archaeon]MBT4716549.1 methyltransferase [Candidatus Woesearchaeota archaeon]MBT7106563.1 methyltransferase [Candidatus Woesearchaeota archaeon]
MTLDQRLLTGKDRRDYEKVRLFFGEVAKHIPLSADTPIVDLCCGNGMLGFYFLELYPEGYVHFYDQQQTERFRELAEGKTNYTFHQEDINTLTQTEEGILLSIHACYILTDKVIELGLQEHKPFAIMPCCHRREMIQQCETPPHVLHTYGLADYIDITRANAIRDQGRSCTLTEIKRNRKKKNNLIIVP